MDEPDATTAAPSDGSSDRPSAGPSAGPSDALLDDQAAERTDGSTAVLDEAAVGGQGDPVQDDAAAPDLEVSTGHAVVDDVLRSLGDLDERPVAEHVQVFERAHDSLRRALSDAGQTGQAGQAGHAGHAEQPERG